MELVGKYIGEWGRYQAFIYILLCTNFTFVGTMMLAFTFTSAVPRGRCFINGLDNASAPTYTAPYAHTHGDHLYAPSFIQRGLPIECSVCEDGVETYMADPDFDFGPNRTCEAANATQCPGSNYIYDQSQYYSTLTTRFNLVCIEGAWKRQLASSMFMLGVFIGAQLGGFLGDKFGRRPVFLITQFAGVAGTFVLIFVPNFTLLCILQLLNASVIYASYMSGYVIAMELTGGLARTIAGVWVQGIFAIGYVYVGVMAYLLRNWQHLQLALALPGLLTIPCYWLVPESIRWLLVNGRIDDAKAVVLRAARMNRVTIPEDKLMEELIAQAAAAQVQPSATSEKRKGPATVTIPEDKLMEELIAQAAAAQVQPSATSEKRKVTIPEDTLMEELIAQAAAAQVQPSATSEKRKGPATVTIPEDKLMEELIAQAAAAQVQPSATSEKRKGPATVTIPEDKLMEELIAQAAAAQVQPSATSEKRKGPATVTIPEDKLMEELIAQAAAAQVQPSATSEKRKGPATVTIPEDKLMEELIAQAAAAQVQPSATSEKRKGPATVKDLFRHRSLATMTLIIFYAWFACSMTYYGISLNTTDLPGDTYVNYLISGFIEFPGFVICIPMMERLGRRTTIMALFGFGGACILVCPFLPSSVNWLIVTLASIGKLGAAASFAVVYNYTAELFPTVVRNSGLGVASSCARIASISAPQISLLGFYVARWLPFFIYGVIAVVGAVLCAFLPETLGTEMPETMADGLDLVEGRAGGKGGLFKKGNKNQTVTGVLLQDKNVQDKRMHDVTERSSTYPLDEEDEIFV